MDFKVVTWNLCGLSKLVRWPSTFEWLAKFDIALIQESLQTTSTFHFNDVTRFDVPAVASGGRARGGLVILLRNSVFGACRLRVVLQDDTLLGLEICSASSSFLVVNVYAPIHTPGYSAEVLRSIRSNLEALLTQFPTTPIIVAGTPQLSVLLSSLVKINSQTKPV